MRYQLLYILFAVGLLFTACGDKQNSGDQPSADSSIEISFAVQDFTSANSTRSGVAPLTRQELTSLRATDAGSANEQRVDNLYLLMFDSSGANPFRYYITGATFAGGTYDSATKKVTLKKTYLEAGRRKVYLVANVDAATKNALDGVTTESALKALYKETAQPWANNISAPLLMTGYKEHNFAANPAAYRLDHVVLVRAVAKVELNIKLSAQFQVVPTVEANGLKEYRYRFVNFDKRTYLDKSATKTADVVSSAADAWPKTDSWSGWRNDLSDTGVSYTPTAGKVTELKLITYLNEQDAQGGATIDIALPYVDLGPLPPPEFGLENYKLPLKLKIERNKWYKFDIEI